MRAWLSRVGLGKVGPGKAGLGKVGVGKVGMDRQQAEPAGGEGVAGPAAAAAASPLVDAVVVRNTDTYRVTFYPRTASALVIVFISAGQAAPGQPVEEFKRTLDRFDAAVVFVLDRRARWFNYDETTEMWAELREIAAGFRRVATVGESMGGCGAILAHRELGRVDRTLALSPQHSILKPFVDFDQRYEGVSRQITSHRYVHFSDAPEPERCVVLFGNREWRDYLHSAMFAAYGFRPLYVEGANHNVAAFLKRQPGNALVRLMAAFLDWEKPFNREEVKALLGELGSEVGMYPNESFASEAKAHNHALMAELDGAFLQATGRRIGDNLALGRPALQSSLSSYSRGRTVAEDAGRAVAGPITGSYAFHTNQDAEPWWMVDLERPCLVEEVRVFNYMSHRTVMVRAAGLTLLASDDGTAWRAVFRRTEEEPFGGADGLPLVWRPDAPLRTRFVRIEVDGPAYLHLDQVQVFGREAAAAQP